MTWKHILAGICGFTLGFWLCMPRDLILLPRYEVLLLNASTRQGLPSIYVKQTREDYAITGAVSSSLALTDSYGRAAFPSVAGRTSPLFRIIFCGRRMVTHGIHAPCGYLHTITPDVPGSTEASRSEVDLPLKDRGHLLTIMMQPANP